MPSKKTVVSRRTLLRTAAAGSLSAITWPLLHHGPAYSQQPDMAPPTTPVEMGEAFKYQEILDQGRNFFGRASTNLASAIEYAFSSQGQPNAYVVGEEIGGALIGGLRYGEGELRFKDGDFSKVFWQGPSLGFDIGADGSQLMILVYNIDNQQQMFDAFSGPSGLAYVAGGIGVSFHKSDQSPVILAIIRSGIGLRIGVNLGYLRFTSEPTWNPF